MADQKNAELGKVEEKKRKTSPGEFFSQVKAETNKIVWPTRKETMITTGMVFLLVIVASIFFLFADMIIRWGVGLVLGIGR